MRSKLNLLALLAFDLCALRILHGLGSRPWTDLDAAAPPEDAVMALVRIVALGAGWWLAGSTALYGLARISRAGRMATAVGRWTLPAARRLVETALAATLTLGPVSPAFAEQAVPPVVAVESPPASGRVLPPIVAPPHSPTAPTSTTTPREPVVASPRGRAEPLDPRQPAEPQPNTQTREHVVRSGEHLWAIAARTLGDAAPEEIAVYWRRLVTANRERLRSGDPDLIYPGEVVLLPPVQER